MPTLRQGRNYIEGCQTMTTETKPMPDEIYAYETDDGASWQLSDISEMYADDVSVAKYIRADLTQPQGETIEALPEGWKISSVIVRRDKGWMYGGELTYDALLENNDCESTGEGSTPTEAIKAALSKAGG